MLPAFHFPILDWRQRKGAVTMNRRHFAMALCLSFVLGAGWLFGKTAMTHFPPIFIAALRFGLAGIIIVTARGWLQVRLPRLLPVSGSCVDAPQG